MARGIATLSAVALASLAWACGSSDQHAGSNGDASVSGFDGAAGDGSAGDGGSGGDGSADGALPDGSVACNTTVTAAGAAIPQTFLPGTRPPAVGGAIAPGTYVLTERAIFTGSWEGDPANPPPDVPVTRTLVIAGKSIAIAEIGSVDGGAPGQVRSTSTFTVADPTVVSFTEVCPLAGGAPTSTAFSAVGAELTFYPTLWEREVYTRQ